jgi:hypothetical protein
MLLTAELMLLHQYLLAAAASAAAPNAAPDANDAHLLRLCPASECCCLLLHPVKLPQRQHICSPSCACRRQNTERTGQQALRGR